MMNAKSNPSHECSEDRFWQPPLNHTCQHYQRRVMWHGAWAVLAILGWSVFWLVVYHAGKPAKGASHDAITVVR